MVDTTRSIISKTATIGDTAGQIVTDDIPFYECNIHCTTNNVIYGDGSIMVAVISAGAVAYFRNGNLKDFFFKNETPGSAGVITLVASVKHEITKQKLGLD